MHPRYEQPDVTSEFSDLCTLAHRITVWQEGVQSRVPATTTVPYVSVQPVYDESLLLEQQMGHDVAAQAEAYRHWLPADLQQWVHYGMTSSDVVDLALQRQIGYMSQQIGAAAQRVGAALVELRECQFERNARTHGQPALPSTFRHLFATYTDRLHEAHKLFNQASAQMSRTNPLHGPVGDPAHDLYTATQRRQIVAALGLTIDTTIEQGQAFSRPRLTAWLEACAHLAEACAHMALNLRLLASHGEAKEPNPAPEYRGSSSMPHKSNPTRSERICGLAPMVRGYANTHAQVGAAWWDMHSLEHSSLERVVVPDACHLTLFILRETDDVLRHIALQPHATLVRNTFLHKHQLVDSGLTPEAAHGWVRYQDLPH